MSADTLATIIVGTIGFAGAGLSVWATLRIRGIEDREAKNLEFLRSSLEEAKDIRSEGRSRQAAAEATVSRYREPLIGAAFDLQARIYNISTGRFFKEQSSYRLDHTLFVFAQYLGWREIIREDIQFFDLGDINATRNLAELFEAATYALALTSPNLSSSFKLLRGEQRAIGEKMMASMTNSAQAPSSHACLGYAGFVEALRRPDFEAWFAKLAGDIRDVETADEPEFGRLSLLHNALIDLIDTLDPDYVRFPEHLRTRMTVPVDLSNFRRRARPISVSS